MTSDRDPGDDFAASDQGPIGAVYYRKQGDAWTCYWPDRPLSAVPPLLLKICQSIARHQRLFLEHGVKHIAPLKQSYIANEVGCHVTSVSRLIAGIEAQTGWGRLPLRCLFTNSLDANSGPISQVEVKARLVEFIQAESTSDPLSDDDLLALLRAQGIVISRRTVTKYRIALGIGGSRERHSPKKVE